VKTCEYALFNDESISEGLRAHFNLKSLLSCARRLYSQLLLFESKAGCTAKVDLQLSLNATLFKQAVVFCLSWRAAVGRGGDPAGAERTGDTSHFGVLNHFLVIIDPLIHESKSKALAGIYPPYFHWLNV